MTQLSFIALLALVAVHVLAGRLRFLQGTPRSFWLSAAGGISVAYVFLHLLPELAAGQGVMARQSGGLFDALEHHAYLVAWLGLTVFYGVERAAMLSRTRSEVVDHAKGRGVFWLHIASFAPYNALVGYLLVRDVDAGRELLFFSIAMALHFLVTDGGLRAHHGRIYDSVGRWLLAFSVALGGGIGYLLELPPLAVSVLVAFLAGGIILNVLKEELPGERQSRFSAFLLGGACYAVLLTAY